MSWQGEKAYTNEWRTCVEVQKTVSAILITKEKWLTTDSDEYTAQLKRNRPSKYENVECALWSWVKDALSCNLDITGAVLKKKAIGFAMLLSIERPTGGLQSSRRNITFVNIRSMERREVLHLTKLRLDSLSINKLCCCNIVVYMTYVSCNDWYNCYFCWVQ